MISQLSGPLGAVQKRNDQNTRTLDESKQLFQQNTPAENSDKVSKLLWMAA